MSGKMLIAALLILASSPALANPAASLHVAAPQDTRAPAATTDGVKHGGLVAGALAALLAISVAVLASQSDEADSN